MPSVGHVAVGLAAARLADTPRGLGRWTWALLLVTLSLLPDLDVIAFRLGIPYGAPFGHRGAVHSVTFALVAGALVGASAVALRLSPMRIAVVSAVVVASHGLLDTLTDGGKGIALLWPFSNQRYFAPWRPIPVAPIGGRLFSLAGVRLMAYEAVLFSPLFLFAAWPRRSVSRAGGTRSGPSTNGNNSRAHGYNLMVIEGEPPIVCRMDALTAAERQRRGEVLNALRGRLLRTGETDDGVAFTLRGDPDVPALAREFIAYESRCCAFLRFGLDVEADGATVVLRMGGGPGVKEFLRQAFP